MYTIEPKPIIPLISYTKSAEENPITAETKPTKPNTNKISGINNIKVNLNRNTKKISGLVTTARKKTVRSSDFVYTGHIQIWNGNMPSLKKTLMEIRIDDTINVNFKLACSTFKA